MKRITDPSTVVDDLMPGTEYIFRVIAGNHIGSSEPSAESASVHMARSPLSSEFSLDPFDDHYELLDEIGRSAVPLYTVIDVVMGVAKSFDVVTKPHPVPLKFHLCIGTVYYSVTLYGMSFPRGRFGVVYECLHTTTQQTYAAKLLPLDDVDRDHAQHELEMLGKIGHPNVTQLASAYLTQRHFIILFQL